MYICTEMVIGQYSEGIEITDEQYEQLDSYIKPHFERKKIEVEQVSNGIVLSAPSDPGGNYTTDELNDIVDAIGDLLTGPTTDDQTSNDSSFDFGGGDGGGAGASDDF